MPDKSRTVRVAVADSNYYSTDLSEFLNKKVKSVSYVRMNSYPITVALGDGSLVLGLPTQFAFECEEDGTVCTFLKQSPNLFALRFSSLTVSGKTPEETAKIDMRRDLISDAAKKGYEAQVLEDRAWYHEDKNSSENGEPIWLRFWLVGLSRHRLIVSFCCGLLEVNNPEIQETLTLVPRLITAITVRSSKSPLTTQEGGILEKQRSLVAAVLQGRYDTYALPQIRADLTVLQRLVDDRTFNPEQEYEWSCVGVAFGDVLANELNLQWIANIDEYGFELALNRDGTSITVFPRTMLIKRIEKNESPDLQSLLDQLAQHVDRLQRDCC